MKLVPWACTKFISKEEKYLFYVMQSICDIFAVTAGCEAVKVKQCSLTTLYCRVKKDGVSSDKFTLRILQRNLSRKPKPERSKFQKNKTFLLVKKNFKKVLC